MPSKRNKIKGIFSSSSNISWKKQEKYDNNLVQDKIVYIIKMFCHVVTFHICIYEKQSPLNFICKILTKSCENYELQCQIYDSWRWVWNSHCSTRSDDQRSQPSSWILCIYCIVYMPFIWHIAPIHGHMFKLTNNVWSRFFSDKFQTSALRLMQE